MVVTNLEPFDPVTDISADTLNHTGLGSIIETNIGLQRVHYLSGIDAGELAQARVPGTDIPLMRNVTLVHEQRSLMHSLISDIDIPLLGFLLKRSAGARLLIGTDLGSAYAETGFSVSDRLIVHAVGQVNLEKYAEVRLAKRDLYAIGVPRGTA